MDNISKEDQIKQLTSILKKGVSKYISDNDLKADVYLKKSYKHSDNNSDFSANIAIGVDYATQTDVFYYKEYHNYISQEDILIDTLVNITHTFLDKTKQSIIYKVN